LLPFPACCRSFDCVEQPENAFDLHKSRCIKN
jgi:hypothetical protein